MKALYKLAHKEGKKDEVQHPGARPVRPRPKALRTGVFKLFSEGGGGGADEEKL